MRAAAETIAGSLVVLGLLVLIDCLPGMSKHPQEHPALAAPSPATCSPSTKPQMLCDRVTIDGKEECVICAERNCSTVTGVYCAKSCDDAACRPR